MTDIDLTLGDCVEVMAAMEPLSVDHVITDPPYSPSVHAKSRRGLTDYQEVKGKEAREKRTRDLGFDGITPDLMLGSAKGFARIARGWVLVFCDFELAPVWRFVLDGVGLEYVRTCFWRKLGATPQLTGDRPANHVEAIVCAHQRHPNGKPMRKKWFAGGRGNIYDCAIVQSRSKDTPRLHTTQKPLELMQALVRDFTAPGESVFDAFAGSGTTLVACRSLGRHATGVEQDREVFSTGRDRIKLKLPAQIREEKQQVMGGMLL